MHFPISGHDRDGLSDKSIGKIAPILSLWTRFRPDRFRHLRWSPVWRLLEIRQVRHSAYSDHLNDCALLRSVDIRDNGDGDGFRPLRHGFSQHGGCLACLCGMPRCQHTSEENQRASSRWKCRGSSGFNRRTLFAFWRGVPSRCGPTSREKL